uniref:Uncharacterized protein n=1 Tax=Anguilla anguilla TaxID=7936 RepID=A0A0E9SMC5_ANGAN
MSALSICLRLIGVGIGCKPSFETPAVKCSCICNLDNFPLWSMPYDYGQFTSFCSLAL